MQTAILSSLVEGLELGAPDEPLLQLGEPASAIVWAMSPASLNTSRTAICVFARSSRPQPLVVDLAPGELAVGQDCLRTQAISAR